jgi:hypothetical protein
MQLIRLTSHIHVVSERSNTADLEPFASLYKV